MAVGSWQLAVDSSHQEECSSLLIFRLCDRPKKRNVGANPPWLPILLDRPLAPNFSKLLKKK
ncbi:hypothetical protein QUB63_23655 [Microcoleus sp. ARI1-B5]|uniref:hypothetical protein n=1 Tax=unclassified Microcoleus TaxID=2642155 RepID=UPI002FD29107